MPLLLCLISACTSLLCATLTLPAGQLGGTISTLQGSAGGAASSYLRAALLDTACISSWSHESDDSSQIAAMVKFSRTYHSSQYGEGVYIGEPLQELENSSVVGTKVSLTWETSYWEASTAVALRNIKMALDPLNVLHCKQCVEASG